MSFLQRMGRKSKFECRYKNCPWNSLINDYFLNASQFKNRQKCLKLIFFRENLYIFFKQNYPCVPTINKYAAKSDCEQIYASFSAILIFSSKKPAPPLRQNIDKIKNEMKSKRSDIMEDGQMRKVSVPLQIKCIQRKS